MLGFFIREILNSKFVTGSLRFVLLVTGLTAVVVFYYFLLLLLLLLLMVLFFKMFCYSTSGFCEP